MIESFGNEQRNRIDHRPPGLALVSVGAAALVTGVVMLGVDLGRQSRKRKARARATQALIFPTFTHEGAGLGISGKF